MKKKTKLKQQKNENKLDEKMNKRDKDNDK